VRGRDPPTTSRAVFIECRRDSHTATPEVTKLPRLHTGEPLVPGSTVALTKDQRHFLLRVMRRAPGDLVRCFNATDGEFLCRILASEKKRGPTVATVEELIRPSQPPRVRLELFFCILSKRKRLSLLLEKASELGVSTLQPLWSQNTQDKEIAIDASRRQLVESAEQSERMDVAVLRDPVALQTVVLEDTAWEESGQRLLVCRERCAEARPLLPALQEALDGGSERICLLVGPEGGFSKDELLAMEARPFVEFVSLGPNVLRAETAGILAIGTAALAAHG